MMNNDRIGSTEDVPKHAEGETEPPFGLSTQRCWNRYLYATGTDLSRHDVDEIRVLTGVTTAIHSGTEEKRPSTVTECERNGHSVLDSKT